MPEALSELITVITNIVVNEIIFRTFYIVYVRTKHSRRISTDQEFNRIQEEVMSYDDDECASTFRNVNRELKPDDVYFCDIN
uniref:V3 n=1 Tax=Syphacia muris TaxID=451379 RepID=A0A0N5A800_9BILA